MLLNVRLAEPFWRAVGKRELRIELNDGSCVKDLLQHIEESYPAFKQEINASPPTIFIGDHEVNLQTELKDGAQVHLVWPIAGGRCDF
jgi:molybdopterin converting factor small subunit